MSLKKAADVALSALAQGSTSPQSIDVREGNLHLTCELVSVDAVGCAFEQLAVTSQALNGASPDRLKQIGQELSARLTYLLEPISPIEIDAEGCHLQLRSQPPSRDDDGTKYYELLVSHDGTIRLSRYAKTSAAQRQIIPAQVTREVWLRLVDDFAAVAESS